MASVSQSFTFTVARAPHPLPLDPTLADPAWAAGRVPAGNGPWINVTTRSPATYATTAYVLYDDRNLYIGFKAEQAGTPITASQTTNDVGFGLDDFAGIGVDTSGSGSQAYYFETTPRGIRYQQANENVRFRPRWSAAGRIDGGTWSAVLIVPLDVLRVPRGGPQLWRFQFVRGIAARGEHLSGSGTRLWGTHRRERGRPSPTRVSGRGASSSWPHRLRRSPNRAPTFMVWPASERIATSSNKPTATFLPMNVRPFGVDVSYPMTPTVSFVGTLNPGFLQRRNRSANDRASGVPAAAHRVPALLRPRRQLHQRQHAATYAHRQLHDGEQPGFLFAGGWAVRQRSQSGRNLGRSESRCADLPRL